MSRSDLNVTVLDYGVGNTLSVTRAFEAIGCSVKLAKTASEVRLSDRIILPGVGAFGDCISKLSRVGLDEAVVSYVDSGRPVMGICVGMQMLFQHSTEFGFHEGLGVLEGSVSMLPTSSSDSGADLRLPQIGWYKLHAGPGFEQSAKCGISESFLGHEVYLVHSFHAKTKYKTDCVATYKRANVDVCAAVQRGNVFGTQFHPEKSGELGLSVLKRFASI